MRFLRCAYQTRLSEGAPLRSAFLKARLSDSPFRRRACQIRLSVGAPLGFAFLRARLSDWKSFEIVGPFGNCFVISLEITLDVAVEITVSICTGLCPASLCSARSDHKMIRSNLVYIYIYIYIHWFFSFGLLHGSPQSLEDFNVLLRCD